MNNDPKPYDQVNPSKIPKILFSGMGLYLLTVFISLALGIGFILIWFGLIHIVLWFAPYWEPAYKALFKALNTPPPSQEFVTVPVTWWRAIVIGIKAAVILCVLYLGFRTLLTQGFLSQNIIYWVVRK